MSKNQLVFGQDQKTMDLSLEELEQTATYSGAKKHEMPHHELFRMVVDDLTNRGYEAKVDKLFVSSTGVDYPTQKEVERKGYLSSINDIRGVIVRNCIGRIALDGVGLADKDSHQEIGISYNKQGIAMAMGQHVNICSNFNVYGTQHMQNYGYMSIPFTRMVDIMSSWIQNMKKIRARDKAIWEGLRTIEIDPIKEVDEVVGHLHRLCEANVRNSKIIAPLNHSRIHELQRGMMNYEGEMATAYNFYQAATEVSTHQNVIENRLINTANIGNYFCKRYGIDAPSEFEEAPSNLEIS